MTRRSKGSNLLRKGRRSIINQPYLITTSTLKREKLFLNAEAGRTVLKCLRQLEAQERIVTEAAVVMPDHVHFVATLKFGSLAQLMQRFKGVSARMVNSALGRQGPVWQRNYHEHAVRREEDLSEVMLYVLNNPVRAGLVEDFHDYPYWYCRWDV